MNKAALILWSVFWCAVLFAQPSSSLDQAAEHVEQGDLPAASLQLKSLTKDAGDRGAAHFWLGKIAMRQKKYDAAIAFFEQAVALNSEQDEYVMELFAAYAAAAKRANSTQAVALSHQLTKTLQAAATRLPDNPKPRLILATYYAQTPKELGGDFDAAVREARTLIRMDPYRGRIFLGKLFADKKRLDEAKNEYTEALLLRADDVTARLRLGAILQDEAKFDEAYARYHQVLQLEPNNLIALYQLGRLAAISGRFCNEGLASLERYLADDTKQKPSPVAAAYWRMGNIAEQMHEPNLAVRHYESALAADPKYHEAAASLRKLKASVAQSP
jgi:tetratricopeptide (TPR) repeat protein